MAVWDLENAAHLLRRVGFGGTPEQIQEFHDRHTGVSDAVDELLTFGPSGRKPPAPNDVSDDGRLKMQRWWIKQMAKAPTPSIAAREKLVLFWHNHLVSGASKQATLKYMSYQNGLFRSFAQGNFKDLIREFNRDPANLYYLDGISNVASTDGDHTPPYATPNENFGRELQELFTLGRSELATDGSFDPTKPNYSESDVHNMARACTGWTSIQGKLGVWNQSDWDGGQYDDNADGVADPMVIYGNTSNNFRIDDGVAGSSDDVLELIFTKQDSLGNNAVGMHISKKLWTWYAYPPPVAGLRGLLAGFANTFQTSNFELNPLLKAMFTHDEFYSDRAKSRTIKSPIDYIVQTLRAFGIKSNGKAIGDNFLEQGDHARIMGMNLFEPPNVAGWPGGLDWINSGTLLARAEFAKELASADSGGNRLKLSNITGLPLGQSAADPGEVVDAILAQLGLDQGPIAITPSSAQRTALINYATTDSPTLDLSNDSTDDANTKVRGLVSLALEAAEHNTF